MKVLVLGCGGREHAIAWKLKQSPRVKQVFVAPGNGGTALEAGIENIAIDAGETEKLIAFANSEAIDFTVVGPEGPLATGVVDSFEQAGLLCLGPSKACAQLEASKAFSKAFMAKHQIATAQYQTFTAVDPALAYLETQTYPLVIKASGLAAGKGVVITQDPVQARETIIAMLTDNCFGGAGAEIVIEAFLTGVEASFIVISDGNTVLPLASSQDHKARDNGNVGPNTGGMGAFSPSPHVSADLTEKILSTVIAPVITNMAKAGTPYRGFLYAGLMIAPSGEISVLEFNCRLGDPETQPILMRLQSDFATLCLAACTRTLDAVSLQWDPQPALGVVLASDGYPGPVRNGDVITGLTSAEESSGCKVFHAGTKQEGKAVTTQGGRVLCVTACGETLAKAQAKAYQGANKISWPGSFCRTDIGELT